MIASHTPLPKQHVAGLVGQNYELLFIPYLKRKPDESIVDTEVT